MWYTKNTYNIISVNPIVASDKKYFLFKLAAENDAIKTIVAIVAAIGASIEAKAPIAARAETKPETAENIL